ncbi:MAG: hypothetical protein ACRDOI_15185 [Trebonia sp.]
MPVAATLRISWQPGFCHGVGQPEPREDAVRADDDRGRQELRERSGTQVIRVAPQPHGQVRVDPPHCLDTRVEVVTYRQVDHWRQRLALTGPVSG